MGIIQKLGWAGGVNLLVDPHALRDDQLANGKNCWPTVEGILAKREAVRRVKTISTDVTGAVLDLLPITIFKPDPITGFDYILDVQVTTSGLCYLIACSAGNSQTATREGGGTNPTGEGVNAPLSMVNYNGMVIVVGRGASGYFMLHKVAGVWTWSHNQFSWPSTTTGATKGQSQLIPPTPRVVCTYKGRLVFGNMGPGFENTIVFADRNPPADWANDTDAPFWSLIGDDVLADNGPNITFSGLQGETIRAMAEISMSSATNPLQTALLILTERSAMICTGEPAQTTDTDFSDGKTYQGDFAFAKVNFDCGIAGPYAICRGPNGTFWANDEDVYALYDGMPKPCVLGTNIRPALQACQPDLQQFWHMAYANGVIHLSVATQASSSYYQAAVNHWRLDLRPRPGEDGNKVSTPQGPSEARWWGPMDYSDIYLMGGSTNGTGLQGSLGVCIFADRDQTGKSAVYGGFYGDYDPSGDKALHIVSFTEQAAGRDIPYKEVSSGLTWAPYDATTNPMYAVGDVVQPTPLKRNGRLYVCTVGGRPGNTEPTWPTTNGASVVDNAVTWTEILSNNVDVRLPNYYGSTAPRIAMEPDFKEYDFGSHMIDKLVKRFDISAYFSSKSQVWMDILCNGGNNRFFAGPAIIGAPTNGKDPAYNELGSLVLGTSSLAQEFQARQMRPNSATNRVKPDTVTPGIIRGRTIQPRLREGDGFVVDDSNGKVVLAIYNSVPSILGIMEVTVGNGYYANVDALMSQIVLAINTALTVGGLSPWTWPAFGQFTYDSNFVDIHPYLPTFIAAPSARQAFSWLAFLVSPPTGSDFIRNGTMYGTRACGRLLAQLGFDTSSQQANAGVGPISGDGGTSAYIVGESLLNSVLTIPVYIYGVQSLPYTRSPVVAITDLEGEFIIRKGRPMPNTNRTS